jgi:DNA mismatch repair protein MutL
MGFKEQQLLALAQLRNTYILAHSTDGLMIIDQHAAAEKVMYEQLFKNMHAQSPSIQMLLVPFSWEVAMSLYPVIKEKLPLLQKMGFFIEPFGSDTFLVKGHPSVMGERFDLHSLLDSLVDVFTEPDDRKGGHERNFEHRVAALTACKASIKAGDALDLKSCQFILGELTKCDDPLTCPHGRPTVIRMSFSELERRFRRT